MYFLSQPAENADLASLEKIQKESERFKLLDQVFYLYTLDGFHGSKIGATAEKHLGVPVTARNLKSAAKIAELAS